MLSRDELGLMSNVSIAAADAFVLCKERGQEGEAMLSAVAKFYEQIKVFASTNNLGPPPRADQSWLDFDRVKNESDNTAVAVKERAKLLPKVIMYDKESGAPINAQDVRSKTAQEVDISTIPWKEWIQGSVARQLGEKQAQMAAIVVVLNSLHVRGKIHQAPIEVFIDWQTKRNVVRASEDLPAGSLALPPCVPQTSRVYDKSCHPHRVPVTVSERAAVVTAVADGGMPTTRKTGKAICDPSGIV